MYHFVGTFVYVTDLADSPLILYFAIGNQYMTAPAFGSLQPVYKKIAFSFAIPTIIFLGSLYSVRPSSILTEAAWLTARFQSVSSRFIFFRLFKESKHRHSNTVIGWASWTGIVAVTWVLAFIIAEVIPFFSDMLSLMSSLFDGWFGYVNPFVGVPTTSS